MATKEKSVRSSRVKSKGNKPVTAAGHDVMQQRASVHDTFWDFISLMRESTHMLMWLMSDRAKQRGFRMM